MNAYYLNQIGSEMFLDTALMKESAVSHSKELNYIPRSRSSSIAKVFFNIFPGDTPDYITIPKNYAVTTTVDSKTLNFLTSDSVIIRRDANNQYISSEVEVYEGSIVTERYTAADAKRYILQSKNMDNTSISVKVTNESSNTYYTQSDYLYGLDETSTVFFVQGYAANQYEIVFGDNVIGKRPTQGSVVEITYRDTVGDAGNGAFSFKKTSSIDGYTSITITTVEASKYGSERETLDQIKFNAPRFYETKNNAVVASDFRSLTIQKFPQIESVIAYGGEEADLPQYGAVIVAVKPYGSNIISDDLRANIKAYLETKTLTTEVVITEPEYFYIGVTSLVSYDPVTLSVSPGQLKSDVETGIINFSNTYLNKFGNDFRYSKLLSYIDSINTSIESNETDIVVIYKWIPEKGFSQKFSFSYDNSITSFKSTLFTYVKSGVTYTSAFLSAVDGVISIYEYINDSTTSLIESNIGTVNYTTGLVSILLEVTNYSNYIGFQAELKNKDFISKKNKVLIIDPTFLQATVQKVIE